jgi:hypothetical protein
MSNNKNQSTNRSFGAVFFVVFFIIGMTHTWEMNLIKMR